MDTSNSEMQATLWRYLMFGTLAQHDGDNALQLLRSGCTITLEPAADRQPWRQAHAL